MLSAFKKFMSKRTIAAPVRNRIMNSFSNYEAFKSVRLESEVKRHDEGRNHEVLYFHKVDDPYSHLTIQSIEKLKSSYNISFKPILVGEEDAEAIHENSLYSKYCLEDVKRIAPFYDIAFPGNSYPTKEMIYKANSILSAVNESKFSEIAIKVSFALWSGDEDTIDNLGVIFSSSKDKIIDNIVEGNKIRNDKGYYFGSAFYYENELYWGLDRLNYLEERLSELGLSTNPVKDPICSLNLSAPKQIISDKKVNLTYYPSLNSPYTLVSAKRVKELSETYPINLITKPVLPMLMRDMTIPEYKAKYIISDAAREGRKYGHEIKNIYSPLGYLQERHTPYFLILIKQGRALSIYMSC